MPSFERFVNSSTLSVVVPNVVLEFPTQDSDHSVWLSKLRSDQVERERAFYDECLDFFFVLCLEQPDGTAADPAHPPPALLAFLAHTQVSYDAAYISSASAPPPPAHRQSAAPPRTASLKPNADSGGGLHVPPSMFPPNTPHPTPVTTEQDRRYVRAEGVTLVSRMWGEEESSSDAAAKAGSRAAANNGDRDRDAFALLWDERAGVWAAVYRMCVNVAFLSFAVRDPLLCLTASITVRERPVSMTPARAALAAMLKESGGLPESQPSAPTESFNDEIDKAYHGLKSYHGLDEVNLLWGLSSAPTFASAPSPLSLPSTRIGAKIRKQDFALPSDPPSMVDVSASRPSLGTGTTLRKSFRRTLSVVSGFRVRMRTVFVPYILLHPSEPDAEVDHALAAGQEEHTIMLCVELEHAGEAPEAFLVEAVDVAIGVGGGARVRLLPWCEKCPQEIFPLRLDMHEQCNLLFAVELFGSPVPDKEALLLNPSTSTTSGELQRPVAITVRGRPFSGEFLYEDRSGAKVEETDKHVFPTRAFPSRWNCVLDLAPQRPVAVGQRESEALPEPPTPFPTSVPRLPVSAVDQRGQQNPVAGFKRSALQSSHVVPRTPHQTFPPQASPSPLRTGGSATPNSSQLPKLAYAPPSLTAAISSAPRTTYAAFYSPASGIPPPALLSKMLPMAESDEAFMGSGSTTPPPVTPAYPAYPKSSTIPSTPRAQGPLTTWGVARTPAGAVELPRSEAPSRSSPAPLPLVPFSPTAAQRECVVVSVGLRNDDAGAEKRGLVPYDEFALDVFIFNQSSWTRRFEVSFLERRRRRQGPGYADGRGQGQSYGAVAVRGKAGGGSGSGIVPLESRVRVGPLRSATCQSVRMTFLALVPGVHTLAALTLTDTETQHALTLRTSIDVVVHETRPLN